MCQVGQLFGYEVFFALVQDFHLQWALGVPLHCDFAVGVGVKVEVGCSVLQGANDGAQQHCVRLLIETVLQKSFPPVEYIEDRRIHEISHG